MKSGRRFCTFRTPNRCAGRTAPFFKRGIQHPPPRPPPPHCPLFPMSGPLLHVEEELGEVKRVNKAIEQSVEAMLKNTSQHAKGFIELSNSLRGMLNEVRKSICYFQDPESLAEEYARFVKKENRHPVTKEVIVDTWSISLYTLYLEVISVGGFVQTTHDMGWERVFLRIDPQPTKKSYAPVDNIAFTFELETALKEAYLHYLYPYEYSRRKEWVDGE
eukprot:TRINITY_DN9998_c0_g1_i1.p1 TRINITY_DN9998_c0_g1~~TRINITY_DN9998_c0_g1_i1.p1  ORF type:complete len:218 (+),score=30.93 TRINITY_DN9998_c0_g1_i1:65-718(+)